MPSSKHVPHQSGSRDRFAPWAHRLDAPRLAPGRVGLGKLAASRPTTACAWRLSPLEPSIRQALIGTPTVGLAGLRQVHFFPLARYGQ